MRWLRRPATLLGALGLAASLLPAGLPPAQLRQAAADAFPYTYVEIPIGPGRPSSRAYAVNSSGLITGGWSLGVAWTSDNGAPIQLIGTLGGCCSYGLGLNDAGDVVGTSYTSDFYEPGHAFIYHNGRMVDLGTGYPTHGSSTALSVNSSRVAVGGRVAPATFVSKATLWQADGQLVDLGTLGGNDSTARGINDTGQVVGESLTIGSGYHAFLWQDGVMQDLGTLGSGGGSGARAINGAGTIAGWANAASGSPEHAVLWQDGAIADLGALPGRPRTQAYALNNAGQVVGLARGSDNHAFLWQDGVMQDLNDLADLPPGVVLAVAFGINDNGLIVGQTCYDPECPPGSQSEHAFLLVPNNPGAGGSGHARVRAQVRHRAG